MSHATDRDRIESLERSVAILRHRVRTLEDSLRITGASIGPDPATVPPVRVVDPQTSEETPK